MSSNNILHCITDLSNWPILRCLPLELLGQVHQVYAVLLPRHANYYLLLVCTNGKVYETEVDVVPKVPLCIDSLIELTELHGVTLLNAIFDFPLILVTTEPGDLYMWGVRNSRYSKKTRPRIVARNVAKVCVSCYCILILYRDGSLTYGTLEKLSVCLGPQAAIQVEPTSRVIDIDSTEVPCRYENVWMALARTNRNSIITWRYSRSFEGGNVTRFFYQVPYSISSSQITAATFIGPALLFVTTSGRCYLVGRGVREKPVKLFEVKPEDPIDQIYTALECNNSTFAILVSRTGRLYVAKFVGLKLVRVIHSSFQSVADAIGLNLFYLQTVTLTTIAPEAIEAVARLENFNNPLSTPRFALAIAYYQSWRQSTKRVVFVDRALLRGRSAHLAKMFQDHWREPQVKNNIKNNVIDTFRYPVYFSYLYYHHTDSLEHLEPDLVLELLQLAITYDETQLADRCRLLIRENLTVEDMFRLYPHLPKPHDRAKNVMDVVSWYLNVDNFARWLKLAHCLRDYPLWLLVSRFVRNHFEQVVHHSTYCTIKLPLWHAMMKTAAKLSQI